MKRIFDLFVAVALLLLLSWLLLLALFIAAIDTFSTGIFMQERIGQYGKIFTLYKIKTLKTHQHSKKMHASYYGNFLRRTKLDELPQLINVLQGSMSIVGPRPDIGGYYDLLKGEGRLILNLKPGLTSTAAIKYANEKALLAKVADPQKYNDEVIFPDKVKMNLDYYYNRSFFGDLKIIWKTFLGLFK